MQDQELVLNLASFLYEKKAQDIVVLRVSHLTVLCDYLVIASGRTASQVSSLADLADEFMAKAALPLRRTEGQREAAGSFSTTEASWSISSIAKSAPITGSTGSGTTEPTPWICPSIRRCPTDPVSKAFEIQQRS